MTRHMSVDMHIATPIPLWLKCGLTAWMTLQLGRLIAIPLIQAVLAGADSPVWVYPAVLDVVVAATTPFLLVAIWRMPGSPTWLASWTYFVVSIVDHGSAITSTLVVGMPATFQQMFNLPNDAALRGIMMGPGGQTLIDLVCLALLLVYRDCFRINRLLVKYQEDSPA